MDDKHKCECVIGIRYDDENTDLISLSELKEHIEDYNRGIKFSSFLLAQGFNNKKKLSLAEYCDGRRSTDLTRFRYCPFCGERIDWKAIKADAKLSEEEGAEK